MMRTSSPIFRSITDYSYNNPLNYTDPSGHSATPTCECGDGPDPLTELTAALALNGVTVNFGLAEYNEALSISEAEKVAILTTVLDAVNAIATRIYFAAYDSGNPFASPEEAFKTVMGATTSITITNQQINQDNICGSDLDPKSTACNTGGLGGANIFILLSEMTGANAKKVLVHEFGHNFTNPKCPSNVSSCKDDFHEKPEVFDFVHLFSSRSAAADWARDHDVIKYASHRSEWADDTTKVKNAELTADVFAYWVLAPRSKIGTEANTFMNGIIGCARTGYNLGQCSGG